MRVSYQFMLKRFVKSGVLMALMALPVFSQALDIQLSGAGETHHAAKGVLVDDLGTLATVAISGTDPRKVTMKDSEGKEVMLKLLAHDVVSRITLLEVPEGVRNGKKIVSDFGDSMELKPATTLKRGLGESAGKSLVVSRDKRFNGRVLPLSMIRVNHGEAGVVPGTPLFDGDGKLVAFTHQGIADERTTSYALPVEVLKHIVAGQKGAGKDELRLVKRCWVGIALEALNDAPVVTGVRPESPARKAGIVKGDVLLSVDGKSVGEYADVVNSFYYLLPGKLVSFKVLRGTEVKDMSVVPEVNPLLVDPK